MINLEELLKIIQIIKMEVELQVEIHPVVAKEAEGAVLFKMKKLKTGPNRGILSHMLKLIWDYYRMVS